MSKLYTVALFFICLGSSYSYPDQTLLKTMNDRARWEYCPGKTVVCSRMIASTGVRDGCWKMIMAATGFVKVQSLRLAQDISLEGPYVEVSPEGYVFHNVRACYQDRNDIGDDLANWRNGAIRGVSLQGYSNDSIVMGQVVVE